MSDTPPPAALLVQRYPTPGGAPRSDRFAVTAGGVAVFVEHWRDVSYARFAVADAAMYAVGALALLGSAASVDSAATMTPIAIEIRVAGPVDDVRVLPRSAIAALTTDGSTIRFRLLRAANLAVLIAGTERLFVLADPPLVEPGAVDVPRVVDAAGESGAAGLSTGPRVVSVVDHGAVPDAQVIATAALQRAIDDVAAGGGGTVVVPAGTFMTGTLRMRSHVTLYLAPGAVLRGSPDPADYPIDPGRRETGSDTSIAQADARFRGETMTFSRLLLFDHAEDAHLAGRGTLDGNGTHLRMTCNAVPNLIRVRGGRGIAIRDVLLRDAAAWTVHILGARHVTADNLKILNDRGNLNTDGIDPDGSQDVAVRGCLIYTKDDAVCVKATENSGLVHDVERVEVIGNVVSSLDAALKVGTESQTARFADIVFRDNDVFDSGRAMSIVVRDGAIYANLAFHDIRVAPGVRHLVEQVIGTRAGRTPALGRIDQLRFEDIAVTGFAPPASNRTWYTQFRPGDAGPAGPAGGKDHVAVFAGADATHDVRGLVLRNVVVNGVHLRDRATAAQVAQLTIGPHVDDVTIE